MKVLFFSDIHGSLRHVKKIKKLAQKESVELIICAGDLTNFEDKLDNILFELNNIDIPILMIHGNHESEESLRTLSEVFDNTIFIHNKAHEIGEYLFIGYGGGGFRTQDPEFQKHSKNLKKKIKKHHKVILVTHGPPHNTTLDDIEGEHVGNKDYRKFIEETEPILAVSGHLHENFGKSGMIKRTRILNPGKEGIVLQI